MSRGGRGGFRGGFGGGGGPSYGDPDLKPDYSVTELFPPQPPPVQAPLTKEERAIVARFRSYRDKIHNGPLYTVMGKKRGAVDPFNDVAKYSDRYKRQKRKVPRLDARPYVHEYFPRELYPTLGVDPTTVDKENGDDSKTPKKKLLFSALDILNPLDDLGNDASDAEENGEGADGEGKKKGLLDGNAEDDEENEDAEDEEEEVEDDFGDDEEGDYNAEQYFDDGEDEKDDYGDDYDEGGEGYF
ncbi:DNA-directed RNA polymerase III subunit C31 [Rhizina undulata]